MFISHSRNPFHCVRALKAMSASPYLEPDAEVEFCSEIAGQRSWSIGKIVSRPSFSPDHVLVEYDYEQDTNPKTQSVSIDKVRPRPPPETHHDFKIGDKVDAYDKGSWREGHLVKELEDGKFAVDFNLPKQLNEFPKENLRTHREWIDDHWEPPIQQQKQVCFTELQFSYDLLDFRAKLQLLVFLKELFRIGDLVEVSSEVEGYRGAWFLAEVVELKVQGKFLVEHKHLLHDVTKKLLEEKVDDNHIRPLPPNALSSNRDFDAWKIGDPDAKYKLLDRVDAQYLEGWSVAMIRKVHGNNTYDVWLEGDPQPLDGLTPSQLRRHYDRAGCDWDVASQV